MATELMFSVFVQVEGTPSNQDGEAIRSNIHKAIQRQADEVGLSEGEDIEVQSFIVEQTERHDFDTEGVQIIRVTNIKWDTDGEPVELPEEVIINVPAYSALAEFEDVVEWLSAEYSYLVESCSYEVLEGPPVG